MLHVPSPSLRVKQGATRREKRGPKRYCMSEEPSSALRLVKEGRDERIHVKGQLMAKDTLYGKLGMKWATEKLLRAVFNLNVRLLFSQLLEVKSSSE